MRRRAGTNRRAESFDNGMEFFATFGGNHVSAAIGRAVLDVIDDEGLVENARAVGEVFFEEMAPLTERHAVIGDVRGRGAMLAVEIVRPGSTTPDAALTSAVSATCHRAGLVTLTCGTFGNVLRFLPPLVISDALLDEGLGILEDAFAAHA